MDALAIAAFLQRRWDLVEREKIRARAERYRSGGPAASFAAAQELRRRHRRQHPGGPTDARRADDLAAHVGLASKLAEITHGLAGR